MTFTVRPARSSDVPETERLIEPLGQRRIRLGKERGVFYEAIQEFQIAEDANGRAIGCGAVHVRWEDLAEMRSLAVEQSWLRRGVDHAILNSLEQNALELGIRRLFCLTFEVDFFTSHGFARMPNEPMDPDLYAELVRSADEGVAEFLDLARVKPNTLGNTRMLKNI